MYVYMYVRRKIYGQQLRNDQPAETDTQNMHEQLDVLTVSFSGSNSFLIL